MKITPEKLITVFMWAQPITLAVSYALGTPENAWYEFGVGFTIFCWLSEHGLKYFNNK
jgi:hypothetical protein